jgi:hypothetical protein
VGSDEERIVKFECKRRWYWTWGREWTHRDTGEPLRFAMTYFGFFTVTKDTDESWWRGWFFHWNLD